MKPTIAQSTIDLVASFEGLSLTPYLDAGTKWAYGYGADYDLNGNPVTKDTPPLTPESAKVLLGKQIASYGAAVNNDVHVPMTQNQFDACVSLCYNIGPGAFAGSSVCRDLNAGNVQAAADAFLLWDEVQGVKNQALLNRREKERTLFLS